MHFTTGQRWAEDAGYGHALLLATQPVLVVLVEQVHGAGLDGVDLAIGDSFHLTFTFVAEDGFDMVLVVNVGFRTRMPQLSSANIKRVLSQLPFSASTKRSVSMHSER